VRRARDVASGGSVQRRRWRVTTPVLPDDLRWLGRPPLHVETGLQGHVLVVVVWRRDDVHGRAAMVELASLAAAMPDAPIAWLSVHVGERDDGDERLAGWLAQLPVPIPTAVVADPAWPRARGLTRLPGLLLVDVLGGVRFRGVGVPRRGRLQAALRTLLDEPVARGRAPDVPFVPHAPLAAPSGAAAMLVDDELVWLALPHRHQVAAFDHRGELRHVFGDGAWGCDAGGAQRARFALPTALAAHAGFVVVSDAGCHALRAIDRQSGEVATWCGTGRIGADTIGGGYGRDQALHSPAGAVSRDGGLYVASEGTGQLWQVDPLTGAAMAWLDGFVEPRGVAMRADTLWVVDAGSAELCAVDLAHVHRRSALRVAGRPVAVAVHGEHVLVADEVARQVLRFDPAAQTADVLLDEQSGLRRPHALAVHGDALHLLDDGRWFVAALDANGRAAGVQAVELRGLPAVQSPFAATLARTAAPIVVAAHSDVTLRIRTQANSTCTVDVIDEAAPTLAVARHAVAEPRDGAVELLVPVAGAGEGAWRVRVSGGELLERHVVPVTVVDAGGGLSVELRS